MLRPANVVAARAASAFLSLFSLKQRPRATSRKGLAHLFAWLSLALLALAASPALAGPSTLCPDQYITVASGESKEVDLTYCNGDGFGLIDNNAQASHGKITGLINNGDNKALYTNYGDGATSDFFILFDELSGEVRVFVTILPATSSMTITPSSLPTPAISAAFSTTLATSGGVAPYTYAITAGALPAGLSLNTASGTISGTPVATGSFSFSIRVTDSTPATPQTLTQAYSFTINHPTVLVTVDTPPAAGLSTPYNHQFSATGGTAPYTFNVQSGSLPPGLSMSPSGQLSGTPSTLGNYSFSLRALDSSGGLGPYAGAQNFSVQVNAGSAPVAGASSVTVAANSTANPITLNLSGGGPTSVAVASAASHGTVTASGTSITYTPTAGYSGPDSFTYTATNTFGTSSPATVTITVSASVPGTPTIGTATAGNASASVGFTPPASNGGSPITGYTVTSNSGAFATGTASPITVTGLSNGTAYTFTVTATNAMGTGAASAASNSVTPVAPPVVTGLSPTSGPTAGGTTMILTGTNFSGTTAVTFGATAATGFTVNSATQITATAPAGTGTVDVRVTTAGGTSATSAADQFTYVNAPTVSAVSPSSGPRTGGTTVVLTGTNFAGTTAVTFGATAATGFTVNSATQITATAPAGAGTVDVRVTTTGGTSATSAADRFTYVGAPTVSSISPSSGPATGGTTVTLTGTNFSGTTAVTFGATAATGFTVNSATQITATAPAGTGTVDVRVTSLGGTSATSAADQFTYVTAPTLTSISPNSGPTAGGTSVTVNGSGFTGATAVSFGGNSASAFTVNSASQITATAPAGSGTVDVRVTTTGGTTATSAADQFTYANAPTIASLAPAVGPTTGGTVVTLSGGGFTGATAVNFGGSSASAFTVNSASQITATAPAGTGTVDVRVTTPGGSSAPAQFTYINVAVGPVSATVAYGSSANPIALNLGSFVPTSVTVASAAAHGTATASGTGISYTPTPGYAGTDTFTYTATNAAGTSAPATVSITVTAPVQTTTASGGWSTGGGQAYSQTLTWHGGAAPYSAFNVSGLPAGLSMTTTTATSLTIAGTPTQTGTFTVTATATDSSTGSGPFAAPATFTLTVGAAPPLTLTPGASTLNATHGSAFTQAFSVSGGIAPYTLAQGGNLPAGVSWNGATATLSGTPSQSGSFAITLTATDGSTGTPGTVTQHYTLQVADETPVAPSQAANSAGPGQPVEVDLTNNASGGPFIAANLLTSVPASVGRASIHEAGAGAANLRAAPARVAGKRFVLRFVPNPDASGVVNLSYTLSNASLTSSPGLISISLSARSDPSKDAEVQGLLNAQANSSRRFASGQINNFQQRLEALHSGNVSPFSNGFTLSTASLKRQRLNDDPTGIEQWLQIKNAKMQAEPSLRTTPSSEQMPALGNQPGDAPTSPLAFWTSGTISIGDDAKRSADKEQKFVTSGLSVGADYRWAPNLTLGVGLGYGHDKTDIGDNGSRSQADSYSVAVYGSYRPIESIYLDGVLGYQRLSFDNRRYVTDNAGVVNGKRDGNQTFASLTAGYEYREAQWLLSPYARLDLADGKLDRYRERGDDIFALSYDEQKVKTTSTSLGLRSQYATSTALGEVTPSLRLEYQHDFQGAGDASMRYAENGSTLYRVSLAPLSQDRGMLGLGLGLLTESDWTLRMEYQFTLGSGAQQTQSMLFNLGKPF